jgi:succinoglycan biosynthesis transport protein ExoP
MDGIQPYASGPRPLVATVHNSPASPSSGKTTSDYLRAVRRRIWLVLIIAIPIAMAGTFFVLRLPAIYQVKALIEVKEPKVDSNINKMVGNGSQQAEGTDDKYVFNALALLSSKDLIEKIIRSPTLGLPPSALEGDPAGELIGALKYKEVPKSHLYIITLDGRDPDRITRTLNFLLREFKSYIGDKSVKATERAKSDAQNSLEQQSSDLNKLQKSLETLLIDNKSLSPGGKNFNEARYDSLSQQLYFQKQQVMSTSHSVQIESARPSGEQKGDSIKASRIAKLMEHREIILARLKKATRIARDKSDPAIRRSENDIADLDAEIAEIENSSGGPGQASVSMTEVYRDILNDQLEGIRTTESQLDQTLVAIKEDMPNHYKLMTFMEDRANMIRQITELKKRIAEFDMLSKSRNEPVEIIDWGFEPIMPIKPNRFMYIVVFIGFSFSIGLGLVCFLEHIDHSVKVPEHLTAGLGLPLFGVVPRMLRNARNHRGGHLWTPGAPESIEADAYRNLRASLLGITTEKKPIVTLLITSAKAGEGKSTTALNLAATCARAGERTLLMDVDLRRPSLNEVFPKNEEGTGLVDILRGDTPWQRTVIQTDLPNLDFLPTGDPRDVPIEVLGSLELRQLLISLSEHHYDRVILDGPAVLGLADCRMLGRIVDGAVMVVRSGSQELRPLQRAKAMLEQSQVPILGLIFNGLNEDLQNWSSYGPNPMIETGLELGNSRNTGSSRGLDSPGSREPSLMAVGSTDV